MLYRKIMNHIIYLATLIEYTSGLILYGEHTHICIIIYKFVLVKSRIEKEDERWLIDIWRGQVNKKTKRAMVIIIHVQHIPKF